MKATKGCGQLSSNDTFFGDIWFRVVKTVEEENTEGVDSFGPVKKIFVKFIDVVSSIISITSLV